MQKLAKLGWGICSTLVALAAQGKHEERMLCHRQRQGPSRVAAPAISPSKPQCEVLILPVERRWVQPQMQELHTPECSSRNHILIWSAISELPTSEWPQR